MDHRGPVTVIASNFVRPPLPLRAPLFCPPLHPFNCHNTPVLSFPRSGSGQVRRLSLCCPVVLPCPLMHVRMERCSSPPLPSDIRHSALDAPSYVHWCPLISTSIPIQPTDRPLLLCCSSKLTLNVALFAPARPAPPCPPLTSYPTFSFIAPVPISVCTRPCTPPRARPIRTATRQRPPIRSMTNTCGRVGTRDRTSALFGIRRIIVDRKSFGQK
jgi:hypothetical protein